MERIDPYELVFGGTDFEERRFNALRAEAAERGVAVADRERLLLLTEAGEAMRELLPEAATAPAVRQFAPLIFHSFHYWLNGKQNWRIEEGTMRHLLNPEFTIGDWRFQPPAAAGYVQLPRNLLWSRIREGAPAEAVDGFFFVVTGNSEKAALTRLAVLLVLGVVATRAGFSVIEAGSELKDGNNLGDRHARASGNDFANVLPGGELQQLFAITTPGEILKLASRCFYHLAQAHG